MGEAFAAFVWTDILAAIGSWYATPLIVGIVTFILVMTLGPFALNSLFRALGWLK